MSEIYNQFRYYYPPRPAIKSTPRSIKTYERMGFIGQPKLNGSCSQLFTDSVNQKFMNRYGVPFTRNIIPKEDLHQLHRASGFQVLCGECMNKSKKDASNRTFNGCLVLFDIMVYKGQYLTGTTFTHRQELMDSLFPSISYDPWISKISDSVYRVKNFTGNFEAIYNEIIKIDMYEGLVAKKPKGILESGLRPNNNVGWQIKFRQSCKNYSY